MTVVIVSKTGVLAPLSSEDSLERKSLVEAVAGTFAGFYNANLRVARRGQRGPVGPACPTASMRGTSLQVKYAVYCWHTSHTEWCWGPGHYS